MDRTRLFGSDWTVTQQWTTIEVPYNVDYSPTRFKVEVSRGGSLVIVLAQPDERYFAGLEGRYIYDLHFRLYKQGVDTYLLRSISGSGCGRSCSAELQVVPGTYIVTMKIKAFRVDRRLTREACIKLNRRPRKDKILVIGRSFDSIHSKGLLREAENAKVANSRTQLRKGKRDRDIEMKKEERKYNQELKRREKLRVKRIDDEVDRKVEVKKAAKRVAREAATARKQSAAASIQEDVQEFDTHAADGETPLTPPTEGGNRMKIDTEKSLTVNEISNNDSEDEDEDGGAEKSASQNRQRKARAQSFSAAGSVNPEFDDDDAISEVSAVRDDDFDWDSDIDDSVDPPIVPVDEDDDIFSSDPWSALCVVGLRVYSKKAPTKISVMKAEK